MPLGCIMLCYEIAICNVTISITCQAEALSVNIKASKLTRIDVGMLDQIFTLQTALQKQTFQELHTPLRNTLSELFNSK